MKALTRHQYDVLRDAARFLNRDRDVTVGPRKGWKVRTAVIGVRRHAGRDDGRARTVFHSAFVGSPGALAHLAEKGYLRPVTLFSVRSDVTGYVWTDEGKAWADRQSDLNN